MKGLAVLLALVGCYRPGSEVPCTVTCSALGECPDGLACNAIGQCALPGGGCMPDDASASEDSASDGPRRDAPSDGGVTFDAVPGVLCVPGSLVSMATLTVGTWFTPDLDGNPQLAVKLVNANILVTEGNANTNSGASYSAMFPITVDVQYNVPRLAPTLQEVFHLRIANNVPSLQRATRVSAGAWTTTTVLLKDATGQLTTLITGTEEIGAPTTTNPRYMLITSGSSITEYVEFSANEWRRVLNHSSAFTDISFLGRATLSESGRRMVFRGQKSGANVAGFYTDRLNPGQPFTTVADRIPSLDTDSVETPYLSEDCRHFYYTHPTSDVIQHATLQ